MMPAQAVQRISIRWLPEPAYEDTETIALNVGGYFIDLRVEKQTRSVQWSRAGERILLKGEPPTYRWTHIIDSLGLTVPDEAYFKKLPNGDDLEIGSTPCPHKGGIVTDYEEVWRDITSNDPSDRRSWIVQSEDGQAFVGKVGTIFLAIRKDSSGTFSVRREDLDVSAQTWHVSHEAGDAGLLPGAEAALKALEAAGEDSNGHKIIINDAPYVIIAICSKE